MTLSFDSSFSNNFEKTFEQDPNQSPIKLSRITEIILIKSIDHLNKEKLIFCYKAAIKAIEAYLNKEYTKFDAQTTTTCCHGISILLHNIIKEIASLDINNIFLNLEKKIIALELNPSPNSFLLNNYFLPGPIIQLAQLYILSYIKEKDAIRGGWRTTTQKLKEISLIGSKFCGDLVKKLQISFSNKVAENYSNYLNQINIDTCINDIPIKLWGKYIQPEYIKIDSRGRKYASCMYSMQVILAYLIQSQIKIAFINDLKCDKGIFQTRYIKLLEGDGHSNFQSIDFKDINFDNHKTNEPIVVFGGCSHSSLNVNSYEFRITSWFNCFPSLILACDTNYPQFPLVRDDSDFDNSPIKSQEQKLKKIIDQHKNINGVSVCDSSLFCLTHIYVASLKQIQQSIQKKEDSLFKSFIPENKKN